MKKTPTLKHTDEEIEELLQKNHETHEVNLARMRRISWTIAAFFILFFGIVLYITFQDTTRFLSKSEAEPVIASNPTPTPNPTVNWKTYTNQHFSYKYPSYMNASKYSVKELSQESNSPNLDRDFTKITGNKILPTIKSAAQMNSEDLKVTFWLFTNEKQETIDSWFEKHSYYPESISANSTTDEKPHMRAFVNTYPGKKGFPEGMLHTEAILLQHNDTILLIFGSFNDPSERQRKLFDQILSTFKFLDEMPSVSPTRTPSKITSPPKEDEVVFCTMDAKVCPDGSTVGRVGPNCEFAACPKQ